MDKNETPLIFWLLAGYFRTNEEKFVETGLFRVTGADTEIRDLELHMNAENFPYLNKVENPHTVCNFWKRTLRSMKDPLIPFTHYLGFGEIENQSNKEQIIQIKSMV